MATMNSTFRDFYDIGPNYALDYRPENAEPESRGGGGHVPVNCLPRRRANTGTWPSPPRTPALMF